MSEEKSITPYYTFETTVFVKFIDRKDFSLAKYHDISLEGFSCFCKKEIKLGEVLRVEINLKMISGGTIDDLKPHIASAKLVKKETVSGELLLRFKFTEFEDHCFAGLVIATEYLDKKEKMITLPELSDQEVNSLNDLPLSSIVTDIAEKIKEGNISLPVLPKVIQDVETVLKKQDTSIDDLASVIEKDAVISGKLLSAANSPFFRGTSHIVTIREAIPRLGFGETRNLVLTIANKSFYHARNDALKSLFDKLWKHSLACAYCAKLLAQKLNHPEVDNLFILGLVHDIGQTLLLRVFSDIIPEDKEPDINDLLTQTERFNLQIGELLFKHWHFSDEDIDVLTAIENETFSDDTNIKTLIIHTANAVAQAVGFSLYESPVFMSDLTVPKQLYLEAEDLMPIGETVKAMMSDSEAAF